MGKLRWLSQWSLCSQRCLDYPRSSVLGHLGNFLWSLDWNNLGMPRHGNCFCSAWCLWKTTFESKVVDQRSRSQEKKVPKVASSCTSSEGFTDLSCSSTQNMHLQKLCSTTGSVRSFKIEILWYRSDTMSFSLQITPVRIWKWKAYVPHSCWLPTAQNAVNRHLYSPL